MGSPGFAENAPNSSRATLRIGVGAASKYRATSWYLSPATFSPRSFRPASLSCALGLNGTSPLALLHAVCAPGVIHHFEYARPRSFCFELAVTHMGPVSTGTGVFVSLGFTAGMMK